MNFSYTFYLTVLRDSVHKRKLVRYTFEMICKIPLNEDLRKLSQRTRIVPLCTSCEIPYCATHKRVKGFRDLTWCDEMSTGDPFLVGVKTQNPLFPSTVLAQKLRLTKEVVVGKFIIMFTLLICQYFVINRFCVVARTVVTECSRGDSEPIV